MDKKTVLAIVRAEISMNEDSLRLYTKSLKGNPPWVVQQNGDAFLAEFGGDWNREFLAAAQRVFDEYFKRAGLSPEYLPTVELADARRGSWIMEAALTMWGTVGTVYTVLKGISELPKIADGLEELKSRLKVELDSRFREVIPARLEPIVSSFDLSPPKRAEIANWHTVTCTIDARPLRSLAPDAAKAHQIHLSVAVSRSALTVENLGDTTLENLRLGLFRSPAERHSWNFGEAFAHSLPRISSKQTVSFNIGQFRSVQDQTPLDLDGLTPVFVDCWIQDKGGIYLFNFYLE